MRFRKGVTQPDYRSFIPGYEKYPDNMKVCDFLLISLIILFLSHGGAVIFKNSVFLTPSCYKIYFLYLAGDWKAGGSGLASVSYRMG